MVKDKTKQKEYSEKWYLKHKGVPVEHKEFTCVICAKSFIQINSRQLTCSKKCSSERHRQKVQKVWDTRRKHTYPRTLKERYDRDPTRVKRNSKRNYEKNKELKNKQNLEYVKARYKIDESFRMRRLLGTALGQVIRYYIKTGKITNPMKKYRIEWKGIIKVLTPIPKPRKDYNIDHIIPLYKFDLSDIDQIHIAFSPENHRWLKAKDNLKRSKLKRRKLV